MFVPVDWVDFLPAVDAGKLSLFCLRSNTTQLCINIFVVLHSPSSWRFSTFRHQTWQRRASQVTLKGQRRKHPQKKLFVMHSSQSISPFAEATHHSRRQSSSTVAFLSQTTIQDLIDFRDSVEPPTPTRSGASTNAPALVGNELVAINEDATLKDAWKTLHLHSIDCVPVWKRVDDAKEFVAFLTLLDLASYTVLEPVFKELLQAAENVAPESSIDFGFNHQMASRVKDIVTRVVPLYMGRKVSDLMAAIGVSGNVQDVSERLYAGSPQSQRILHKFRTTDNLVELTDCMRKGAHKILAFSPTSQVVCICIISKA